MDNRERHFTQEQARAMYKVLTAIEHAALQRTQPGQESNVSSIERVWAIVWVIAKLALEEIDNMPEGAS
jgi:hypothetical protein